MFHRFTALLLVVAMPLCCCVLNAASGANCCDAAPVVEVASCCSSTHCQVEQTEDAPDSDPCNGNSCTCCLKIPSTSLDWSPPVDAIGTPLAPCCLPLDLVAKIEIDADKGNGWDDPPPGPGDPSHLRGQVILQV